MADTTMSSKAYRREAQLLLENTFSRLSCAVIGSIFRQQNHNFTLAFRQLSTVSETGDVSNQLTITPHQKNARTHVTSLPSNGWGNIFAEQMTQWKCSVCTSRNPKSETVCLSCESPKDEDNVSESDASPASVESATVKTFAMKVFIKKDRPKKQLDITDETLLAEIDGIPELNRKAAGDDGGSKQKRLGASIAIDLTTNSDSEEEKECLCCFVDYIVSDLRYCQNNHGVCCGCIQRYVSEQIDGNGSTDLKCIASGDCGCVYTQAFLTQVLSPGLERRTNELIFRRDILHVLEEEDNGLWNCPGCGHVGFVDANQQYPWLHCPSCNAKYCTKCNDEEHGKKSCEQHRREKLIKADPTHQAHEAMSNACKRSCPKCKTVFVKHDGCNKMTCPTAGCKTFICYLCEDDITQVRYGHFCGNIKCQVSGTKCSSNTCRNKGKCKLFTDAEAMSGVDRKRRQDAGRKVLNEKGIINEEEIRNILQSPPDTKQQGSKPVAVNPPRQLPQPQRANRPLPADMAFGALPIPMRQGSPPPARLFTPPRPRHQVQAGRAFPRSPTDIALEALLRRREVEDIPLRQSNPPPARLFTPPRRQAQAELTHRPLPAAAADIAFEAAPLRRRGAQDMPMRQDTPPPARRFIRARRQAPTERAHPLLLADIAQRGVQDVPMRQDNPPQARRFIRARRLAQAERAHRQAQAQAKRTVMVIGMFVATMALYSYFYTVMESFLIHLTISLVFFTL